MIKTFPCGPFVTNAYLLTCPMTRQAAIIDPAPGSAPLFLHALEEGEWKLVYFLITHGHWDHLADLPLLKNRYDVPVWLHEADVPFSSTGMEKELVPSFKGVFPECHYSEETVIPVGQWLLTPLFTPGHTPGSICLYLPQEKLLFSGDTLFKGTIGNLSFAQSEPEQMWLSLKKLGQLPPDTRVLPGHGQATTIGAESWLPNAKQIFN